MFCIRLAQAYACGLICFYVDSQEGRTIDLLGINGGSEGGPSPARFHSRTKVENNRNVLYEIWAICVNIEAL
jgi:hypothetical protein